MIVYFSGNTFNQTIDSAIEESNELVFLKEIENEFDFAKYIKQNITQFAQVDIMILDISVFTNTDEEITKSIEMLRSMYDALRIIIFAAYREIGDDLLTNCFNMGIWNIITTNDYREIREELIQCITQGKTFRDALKYKEAKAEKVIVKHEIKKNVYKKLIAVAGTEKNIGVTHNTIVLANYLRKKGFMIAVIEMNASGAYDSICEAYEEKKFSEGYFTISGVDFYPNVDADKLLKIMEHSYNFLLLDFGEFENADRMLWEKCDEKFIISGAKAWEMEQTNKVFGMASVETLKTYIFCFNFTQQKDHKAILEGMEDLNNDNVHFLTYSEDPFAASDFADADKIFEKYLPDEPEVEKKGIFKRKKGMKNEPKKKNPV